MADSNLAKMTDLALLKLFAINSTNSTTRRTQQIRAELERRGYVFDPAHQTFVPCDEWNARHPEARHDCAEEARRRDNDERRRSNREG